MPSTTNVQYLPSPLPMVCLKDFSCHWGGYVLERDAITLISANNNRRNKQTRVERASLRPHLMNLRIPPRNRRHLPLLPLLCYLQRLRQRTGQWYFKGAMSNKYNSPSKHCLRRTFRSVSFLQIPPRRATRDAHGSHAFVRLSTSVVGRRRRRQRSLPAHS